MKLCSRIRGLTKWSNDALFYFFFQILNGFYVVYRRMTTGFKYLVLIYCKRHHGCCVKTSLIWFPWFTSKRQFVVDNCTQTNFMIYSRRSTKLWSQWDSTEDLQNCICFHNVNVFYKTRQIFHREVLYSLKEWGHSFSEEEVLSRSQNLSCPQTLFNRLSLNFEILLNV